MPKVVNYPKGKRVNVYLLEKQVKTWKEIDNFSSFVQIAVENAADIMAWAMLRDIDPKRYHPMKKLEDVVDDFNKKYPQDPLTQKRTKQWPKNSEKKQELW